MLFFTWWGSIQELGILTVTDTDCILNLKRGFSFFLALVSGSRKDSLSGHILFPYIHYARLGTEHAMEKIRSISCQRQLPSAIGKATIIIMPSFGTSISSVESLLVHRRPAGRKPMPQQIRPDLPVSHSPQSLSPCSRLASVESKISDAHQHGDMVCGDETGQGRASSLRLAVSDQGASPFTRRYWGTVLGPSADISFSDTKVPASSNLSRLAAPLPFSMIKQDLLPLDFFTARSRYTQRLDVSFTESSQVRRMIHLPALPPAPVKNITPLFPPTIPSFEPLVPRLDAEKSVSCNQCDFACSR